MNENFFLGLDFETAATDPINFLETRFCDLSPFSAHEVVIEGVLYKTAEHAYHALRVVPEAREKIMAASCPLDAWREGQLCKQRQQLLTDYDKDSLMEQIFRAKLTQHPDVRRVLVATGNRELLKVHDTDIYWGTGADQTGQNKMGRLWMKLRAELMSIN